MFPGIGVLPEPATGSLVVSRRISVAPVTVLLDFWTFGEAISW